MMNSKKIISLDSILFQKEIKPFPDAGFVNGIKVGKPKSRLFSRGKIIENFFTEDSKLYITPQEQAMLENGIKLNRNTREWDSLSSRIVREYVFQKSKRQAVAVRRDMLLEKFVAYTQRLQDGVVDSAKGLASQWSLSQLWNFSIIGAIVVGMISMTFIYKFLGPGASAKSIAENQPAKNKIVAESKNSEIPKIPSVLGDFTVKGQDSSEESARYIEKVAGELETKKSQEFENKIRSMVKGYPIEKMIPYIMEQDKTVAIYLVAIAKKESSWGVHVPVLEGRDCYNYWGYRGQRKLMGTGGHTCFNSRKDAVDTVAKRIETLAIKQKRSTPDKMVIWKCGSACAKDNQKDVRKWISDVSLYFGKLSD
jgi:hypothetical protein